MEGGEFIQCREWSPRSLEHFKDKNRDLTFALLWNLLLSSAQFSLTLCWISRFLWNSQDDGSPLLLLWFGYSTWIKRRSPDGRGWWRDWKIIDKTILDLKFSSSGKTSRWRNFEVKMIRTTIWKEKNWKILQYSPDIINKVKILDLVKFWCIPFYYCYGVEMLQIY